jgi:hypothetical protein
MLILPALCLRAQDKKDDRKDPDKRGGTVVGEVVKKDKNWIEIKADGEEKARRYFPRWVGGMPSAGGGLDKKILEEISKLKIGSRVKIQWEFEERPRVVKIEVLKEPSKDKPEKDK